MVRLDGRHLSLHDAGVAPTPPELPRVVVGAGGSVRTVANAVRYADELNLYAEPALIDAARTAIAASGRDIRLSLFLDWSWDRWPTDAASELARWHSVGIDRMFVSVGGPDMLERVRTLGRLAADFPPNAPGR